MGASAPAPTLWDVMQSACPPTARPPAAGAPRPQQLDADLIAAIERGEARLVRLRDGARVSVRAATAGDEPALRTLLNGLCAEHLRLRFFTGAVDVDDAAHTVAATGEGRFGLVAHGEAGALVGHALYVQIDATRAEVAVEVADHVHGRGLGTILVEQLAAIAEHRGIERFVAEVMPENHAMLDVFRNAFDARLSFREGIEYVEFPTSAWRGAGERLQG
jgi:GNAT superfamily N-acetyltransferase